MDFSLSIEERDVQMWVRTFVDREIRPLEEEALRNERAGRTGVEPETIRALQLKAREAGFWGGVQTPEELGGMGLSAAHRTLVPRTPAGPYLRRHRRDPAQDHCTKPARGQRGDGRVRLITVCRLVTFPVSG